MTRKRFVKMLMAEGYSRNEANIVATAARNSGIDYKLAYKAERDLSAAKLSLKNVDISAICYAIGKIAEAAIKVASAMAKAVAAFAETYTKEMEANHE